MASLVKTKYCPHCKLVKDIEEFSKSKATKDGFHGWCKLCCKSYHSKNRTQLSRKARDRRRTTLLRSTTEKAWSGLTKRPYTNYCEVCGKPHSLHLNYHHWDDTNPSKGIWVCFSCHMIITLYESGKSAKCIKKYLLLKEELDEEAKD